MELEKNVKPSEAERLMVDARAHYPPISYPEGSVRTRNSRISAEMICSMPTNQGQRGDCAYHAYAKLIIQNMISIFIDLKMTSEETAKMMACIYKHPIDTSTDIGDYSIEDCSSKGYKKIVLFYYFFNYLSRNDIKNIEPSVMKLIGTMHSRAAVRLPLDDGMFSQLRAEITQKARGVEWAFVTFDVDSRAISIVERILSIGLYCVLTLTSDAGRHAVLLQGYDPTTLHIQNSWGNAVDSVPKELFPDITLSRIEFRCERIQTVFPIPGFVLPRLPRGGLTPIDHLIEFLKLYEEQYADWKRRRRGGRHGKRTKRRRGKRHSKRV
jgi:hypothetical protein